MILFLQCHKLFQLFRQILRCNLFRVFGIFPQHSQNTWALHTRQSAIAISGYLQFFLLIRQILRENFPVVKTVNGSQNFLYSRSLLICLLNIFKRMIFIQKFCHIFRIDHCMRQNICQWNIHFEVHGVTVSNPNLLLHAVHIFAKMRHTTEPLLHFLTQLLFLMPFKFFCTNLLQRMLGRNCTKRSHGMFQNFQLPFPVRQVFLRCKHCRRNIEMNAVRCILIFFKDSH